MATDKDRRALMPGGLTVLCPPFDPSLATLNVKDFLDFAERRPPGHTIARVTIGRGARRKRTPQDPSQSNARDFADERSYRSRFSAPSESSDQNGTCVRSDGWRGGASNS